MQVSDIRRHFSKSRISIPDTTAQRLCKRFLKYFIAVHLESTPQIKEKIDQNGGYVLQIDGTQNHGRGTIMLLKDSISDIRLSLFYLLNEWKNSICSSAILCGEFSFMNSSAFARNALYLSPSSSKSIRVFFKSSVSV